ncbi:MAG: 50S ribosomal protein L3 [Proteobacteria bacterium]|nr:50S ribosomal protein L3 [Pseudomonadota bacterium]
MGNGLGILGTKVGMTQLFDADKRAVVPVTVIHAEPNVVLKRFTQDNDGYGSVQVAYGDKRPTRTNRPDAGQYAKASEAAGKAVSPKKVIREWRLDGDPSDDLSIGSEVTVERFDGVKFVDVSGTSKGKGYQGVMKKYNFKGFVRSHGTHEFFRHGGSIGTRLTPGHVLKGKKMPGQMGNVRVTTQNLRLHGVDAAKNLLFIVGAVPGHKGSVIEIRPATKK